MMANKRISKKKEKSLANCSETTAPNELGAILELLKENQAEIKALREEKEATDAKLTQMQDTAAKVDDLAKKQKMALVGDKQYGEGNWNEFKDGSQYGWERDTYIDIRRMAGMPRSPW
jgi:hypothetical protein